MGATLVHPETGSSTDNPSVHTMLKLGVEDVDGTDFPSPPRPSA